MVYKIRWTDKAKENIKDITSKIYDDWGMGVAEKFANFIVDSTTLLETLPNRGVKHSEIDAIRKLFIKPHYVIFYTVVDNDVIILNVKDSRLSR